MPMTSTEQWNPEQFDRNYDYHKALQYGKWREAIRALRNGAQVGYVDPYTGRLDIQIARKGDIGDGYAARLQIVLEKIYGELGRLPQASAIVTDIVDKYMPGDLALARPSSSVLLGQGDLHP